jgi:hypothetical protein
MPSCAIVWHRRRMNWLVRTCHGGSKVIGEGEEEALDGAGAVKRSSKHAHWSRSAVKLYTEANCKIRK